MLVVVDACGCGCLLDEWVCMNCLELSVIAGGYERKIKRFCRENLPSYIHFTTAWKPETVQPGDEETGRLETNRNEAKRSETKMRRKWLNVSGCAPERRARVDGGGRASTWEVFTASSTCFICGRVSSREEKGGPRQTSSASGRASHLWQSVESRRRDRGGFRVCQSSSRGQQGRNLSDIRDFSFPPRFALFRPQLSVTAALRVEEGGGDALVPLLSFGPFGAPSKSVKESSAFAISYNSALVPRDVI